MSDYWFGQLPAALQDALLGAARQRRITPGKLLFAQGDPPCGLYVLLEGAVRMGSAGQQRLTPRLEELVAPFWFGEVSLFDGQPRTLDAYSLVQSIFLQVPQPFIDQWLLEHPEDLRFFAQLLSNKLGLPLLRPEKLHSLPDRARVAWRLLLLCEGYGQLSHARRLVGFEAIEACPTVALSRAALLEVLQDLQQRRIIRLGQEQLEVFDIDKLRKAANVLRARAPC
ncbi:cyclic nucleotide-binding protein [Pseudomonas sp. StFLB209]|nr:cyclic nucleotide-binding protein [Pseudomonas sp. StFLB209]